VSIGHISDTARWVAVYRAMESERPDALFHDPFALRLAGVEGENIVDALPRGRQMAWAMIVRTALFDEFVRRAVSEDGVDTVVNLAAGLDARPWRLELPADLRWFDVDLPGILDHKLSVLEGETPRCRYEARRVDLTDRDARRALFAELDTDAARTLVVTEGLLVYLTREQVAALAADLHEAPSFDSWVIDIASPRLLEIIGRTWGKEVERGNAPFRFAPGEGTAFFLPSGWTEAEYRSIGEEGRRLGREMRGAWLWRILGAFASPKKKEEIRRMSGVVRLVRSPSGPPSSG
jgi:methyltransferase (TIGR00027 family)